MSDDVTKALRGHENARGFFSKKAFKVLAVLLLIVLIPSALYIFFSREVKEPLAASVSNVKGSVLIQRAGVTETVPVIIGMKLDIEDRIVTSSDGILEIFFEDGSVSRVGPDTRLDIRQLHKYEKDGSRVIDLNVSSGSLWNRVAENLQNNSRFDVNTPTSLAGVRGTDYFVRVGADRDTMVRVYEGLVALKGTNNNGPAAEDSEDEEGRPELLIRDMQQAKSSPGIPIGAEAVELDVLDIDEFEKDNLVEDIPIIYIDVEYSAKSILIERTEKRIDDFEKESEILEQEIALLESLLEEETDESRREEFEKLIALKREEITLNEEVVDLLEEELSELELAKKVLSVIKDSIEQDSQVMSEEDLINKVREEARNIRLDDKERQAATGERLSIITDKEEAVRAKRSQSEIIVRSLDVSRQLESIRTDFPLEEADESVTERAEGVADGSETTSPAPGTGSTVGRSTVTVQYLVALNASPAGGGTVAGAGRYNNNSRVEIKAIPKANDGYEFVNWTIAGSEFSKSGTVTFNINRNMSLVANFALRKYDLEYKAGNNGSIEGNLKQSVVHGKNARGVTAVPNSGYRFIRWSDGLEDASRRDLAIKRNISVTALFEPVVPVYTEYNVSLALSPVEGGSIVGGGGKYRSGDSVTVEVEAKAGYRFLRWTEGTTVVASDKKYTFTIESNRNLVANFVRVYDLRYIAGANGSIAGNTSQKVNHGDNGSMVTAVPADGYLFIGWSDGILTNTRTDKSVTKSISVTALFDVPVKYVNIPDARLRGVILSALEKSDEQLVSEEEMKSLTGSLMARGYGIESLTGIEYAVNLKEIDLARNSIDDLTPLKDLANLEGLYLESNKVKNLSPLANLKKLEILYLTNNEVSDISVLDNLTALKEVGLLNNFIDTRTGSTSMATINKLIINNAKVYYEEQNFIITYQLRYSAGDNGIVEGELVQDVKHGEDGTLVTATPNTGYAFDRWSDGVEGAERVDRNVTKGTEVTAIFVKQHKLTYKAGDNGSLLFNGEVNTVNEVVQHVNEGKAGKMVTAIPDKCYKFTHWIYGDDMEVYTHTHIATNVNMDMVITAYFEKLPVVIFTDNNLKSAVLEKLGKGSDDCVTEEDMLLIDSLDISGRSVGSLAGLEYALNMNLLIADNNNIEDLSPLGALDKLRDIYLDNNRIADISSLVNLEGLKVLSLNHNEIANISALADLSGLEEVMLTYNYIDISSGSTAMGIIDDISAEGVIVVYRPQKDEGEISSIAGVVRDSLTEQAIAEVAVRLYWEYEGDDSFDYLDLYTVTDSDGRFHFGELPSGYWNYYDLTFMHIDYHDKWLDGDFSGSRNEELEVDLIPSAINVEVAGVVTDSGGSPLEGVIVTAEWQSGFAEKLSFESITDGSGRYSIDVPFGENDLLFYHEEYASALVSMKEHKSLFVNMGIVLGSKGLIAPEVDKGLDESDVTEDLSDIDEELRGLPDSGFDELKGFENDLLEEIIAEHLSSVVAASSYDVGIGNLEIVGRDLRVYFDSALMIPVRVRPYNAECNLFDSIESLPFEIDMENGFISLNRDILRESILVKSEVLFIIDFYILEAGESMEVDDKGVVDLWDQLRIESNEGILTIV